MHLSYLGVLSCKSSWSSISIFVHFFFSQDITKGRFFYRKYDAFLSLFKKCAEKYPEKEFLELHSV